MTLPSGFTELRLVTGPDTLPEDTARSGQIVVVPDSYPLGSGPTNPSTLLGIFGYTRVGTGSPPLEWVMGAQISAADIAAVNVIPGVAGWSSTAARTVYRQQGRRLVVNLGVPNADVLDVLTRLYNAAKVEVLAESGS